MRSTSGGTLAENRRAYHDFDIAETFEAGLVLSGAEVKSAKLGGVSLKGGYVNFVDGRPVVVGMHIAPYAKAALSAAKAGRVGLYNPTQTRYLLVNRGELRKLYGLASQKGVTLVPLKVYVRGSRLKLAVGVGHGKKLYDKREALKRRDLEKEVAQEVKWQTRG